MSEPPRPVRLQLSRKRGFNLQALSLATNGLDAVSVVRPGKFGNPFLVHPDQKPGRSWLCDTAWSVPTVEDAVECFREMMTLTGGTADRLRNALPELRGKNLACWCDRSSLCHADVLLELANTPICEAMP